MVVISDTSCISNLYQIGQLQLLTQLFQKIIIPQNVLKELNDFHSNDLIVELEKFQIILQDVINKSLVESIFSKGIHLGEAEAIALSIELHADILLIDEKEGKQVAQEFGIRTIGILGVILLAKQEKLIAEAKILFDLLRTKTNK
jgi:uncharacterized protein